ncbi:MAG: cobalamin-dependent protein [Clostridia bacterium]|nr:cobalamin-dependent protein [Clostridia bacterium]
MKKIYFIQAATTYKNRYSVYLPYSVGCLVAYAMQNEVIKSEYSAEKIFFEREKPTVLIEEIKDPFMVAFSVSLWNKEYSKETARIIKERYPECVIVFGGHSVTQDGELLSECPYIDYLIYGEGEEAFSKLLLSLCGHIGKSEVPNLIYRESGKTVITDAKISTELYEYPSPYTTGVFDGLLRDNPDVPFNAVLETNRGCPYGCAYCEWCFTKKLRFFPMQKIKDELLWIARNKIEYCYCADANFGIADRDCETAEYAVSVKKEYGYPFVFRPTYANGGGDTVFEIGKTLNRGGIDKGVTVAYQSLDTEVLRLIGRKNFGAEKNKETAERFAKTGIPTYCELILGLPGETYDSFCSGLCRLLETGNHGSVSVYNCQVYPNSLLGDKEYRKKHGIKSVRVPIEGIHYVADFNGITEYLDIVVETKDLPFENWVKANMFSTTVLTFHSNGLLRFFAMYLFYEKGVLYNSFYNALLDFIMSADGTRINTLFRSFYERYNDTSHGDWVFRDDRLGDIGWYYDEAAYLELSSDADVTYKELEPFLKEYFDDEELFLQLMRFQKNMVRRFGVYECDESFDYDFYTYFSDLSSSTYSELKNGSFDLSVRINDKLHSLEEFAKKTVLFGKRRGETLVFNSRSDLLWKERCSLDKG